MRHQRFVFINIGLMREYKGLEGDRIKGGGDWVEKHKYGHEIYNFQPYRGRCYGYGRAVKERFAIQRLGATQNANYVDDVTVVWVAASCVVGWYEHARLYATYQYAPEGAARAYGKDKNIGYYATAHLSDCKLLKGEARRALRVPRGRGIKHGMGRYVWYPDGEHHKAFLADVYRLIKSKGTKFPTPKKKKSGGAGWQLDPKKRKAIEKAAMAATIKQYKTLKYEWRGVEDEHLGWDLEVELHGIKLLVEVKGVSNAEVNVELTPNEFKQMMKHKSDYRLCVLTNALSKSAQRLFTFEYDKRTGGWFDQDGRQLTVQERLAARLYVQG